MIDIPGPVAVLTAAGAFVTATLHAAASSKAAERPSSRGRPADRETGYPTMRVRPPATGADDTTTAQDNVAEYALTARLAA